MTLAVPRGADYASTKEELSAAVIDALKDYHEEIQRQTRELQRTTMSSSGGEALPDGPAQLLLGGGGSPRALPGTFVARGRNR